MSNYQTEPEASWLYRALNWPRVAIRRLYAWMMRWGDSQGAEKALFGFAFAESSFFPIPPDPLLIAMTTSSPKKWLRFALICTGASVLGAVFGYFVGFALFESIGQPIVDSYGLQQEFVKVGESFNNNAFWSIFTAGFTPIPFKVFTIASGLFRVNILTLLIASALSRGMRFGLVAWLAHKLGSKYKRQIERYIDIISVVFLVLIVLGFLVIKYFI